MLCAQHTGWSQSRVFFFFFVRVSRAPVCLSVCACKSTVACVNPPVEPCSQSSSFWNQAWIIKLFHKAALTIYYMRRNRSSSSVRKIVCMLYGFYWVKKDGVQCSPPFSARVLYLLCRMTDSPRFRLIFLHICKPLMTSHSFVRVRFRSRCHSTWDNRSTLTLTNLNNFTFKFFKIIHIVKKYLLGVAWIIKTGIIQLWQHLRDYPRYCIYLKVSCCVL